MVGLIIFQDDKGKYKDLIKHGQVDFTCFEFLLSSDFIWPTT